MPATQPPQPGEPNNEPFNGQPPPIPDEDGPHDVPDEKVIEKTLPTSKPGGDGKRGS